MMIEMIAPNGVLMLVDESRVEARKAAGFKLAAKPTPKKPRAKRMTKAQKK